MNWQARPQRFGSVLREIPQSVQRLRNGAATGVSVDMGQGQKKFPQLNAGAWKLSTSFVGKSVDDSGQITLSV
jgi:hypothetical protein